MSELINMIYRSVKFVMSAAKNVEPDGEYG